MSEWREGETWTYYVERSDLSFNNFAGNNNNIVVYGVGGAGAITVAMEVSAV